MITIHYILLFVLFVQRARKLISTLLVSNKNEKILNIYNTLKKKKKKPIMKTEFFKALNINNIIS